MATKKSNSKLDSQSSDRIAVDYAFKTNVKFFRNTDRTQKRVLLPFTPNQHIVVKLIEGTKLTTSVKIWSACDPSVTVGHWHMVQYEPEPLEAAQLFQAAVLALQEADSALGQFMDYYGLRSESQQQVVLTPLATSDISYYRAEDQSEQPEFDADLSEALALAEDARQARGQCTEMRARWTLGEQKALRLCRQALGELTFSQQIGEARKPTTEDVVNFIEQWTATIGERARVHYAIGHYQVELEAPDLYDKHQSFITIDVEHRQSGIEVQGVQYENEYPARLRSYPGVRLLPVGDTMRVILLDAAAAYARFACRVHYNVRIPGPFDLTSSYRSSVPEVQLKRIRGEQ